MSRWSGGTRFLVLALIGWACVGCDRFASGKSEESDPDFQRAKSKWSRRDFAGAAESYEAALRTNPKSAAAHRELGLLYYENLKNPSAAIHYLRRYQKLQPNANDADTIGGLITNSMIDLTREVPLIVADEHVQREMRRLELEKAELYKQLQLAQAENLELRNRLAAGTGHNAGGGGNGPQSESGPSRESPRPAPVETEVAQVPARATEARTHVIRRGDTLYSLGKQYGVSVPRILAANPGLDARRLAVGTPIRVPSS